MSIQIDSLVAEWVKRYRLAYFERTKRYVGLHEGMLIIVLQWSQQVMLEVVVLEGDVDEELFDLEETQASGVPSDWVTKTTDSRGSIDTCAVKLDASRTEAVSSDALLRLPENLAVDLYEAGGSDSAECSQCEEPAKHVALFNWSYRHLCTTCWTRIADRPITQRVKNRINWWMAFAILSVATALGTFLWCKYRLLNLRLPVILALWLPWLWGAGLATLLVRHAGGSSRLLRWALFSSIIGAVVVGNTWALKVLVEEFRGEPVGWWLIIRAHFVDESLELLVFQVVYAWGGWFGAWFATRRLRSHERILIDAPTPN